MQKVYIKRQRHQIYKHFGMRGGFFSGIRNSNGGQKSLATMRVRLFTSNLLLKIE